MEKLLANALVTAILVASCSLAPAASIVTFDSVGTSVTLHDTQCTSKKVLRHIPPEHHKVFYAGVTVFEKKRYENCWTLNGGDVFIVDEEGDMGIIPRAAFRPVVLL